MRSRHSHGWRLSLLINGENIFALRGRSLGQYHLPFSEFPGWAPVRPRARANSFRISSRISERRVCLWLAALAVAHEDDKFCIASSSESKDSTCKVHSRGMPVKVIGES